jgi:hypothetical protein
MLKKCLPLKHGIKPFYFLLAASLILAFSGCTGSSGQAPAQPRTKTEGPLSKPKSSSALQEDVRNPGRVIHIVVALCDNKYQGIVPVPERIGNGDDPQNNLYWGAGYGVKNFFHKQRDWSLLAEEPGPQSAILERVVFKHKQRDLHLIADAYRGREIRRATLDFLRFTAGRGVEIIEVRTGSEPYKLSIGGGADLIAYVGHDGLMDFSLPEYPQKADERRREAVILACASKPYFEPALRQSGAKPLLWTTNLMAPEAYVLKATVDGWILGESGEKIRRRAAEAYNRYQNCGLKGAMNLFASGW